MDVSLFLNRVIWFGLSSWQSSAAGQSVLCPLLLSLFSELVGFEIYSNRSSHSLVLMEGTLKCVKDLGVTESWYIKVRGIVSIWSLWSLVFFPVNIYKMPSSYVVNTGLYHL